MGKKRKEKENAKDAKEETKDKKEEKGEGKEKPDKGFKKRHKTLSKEVLKSVLPKKVEVKFLSKEDALKLAVQRAKGKIQIRTIPRGRIGRGKIVFPGKTPAAAPAVGE